MKQLALILALAAVVAVAATLPASAEEKEVKGNPVVVMSTNYGDMEIELYPKKAPKTVENFLWYVDNKFYDGLIFHRVIDEFMIQGGGFTKDLVKKAGNAPIENEAGNGLSNEKYTIAMARTNQVNSATSQFFINNKDNPALDHRDKTARGFGYCVFGKVLKGDKVVDKISKVATTSKNGMNDVPVKPVVIESVRRAADPPKKEKAKE
jgi:cyclophilin family peptidyl-prolyl cis-trans isomerase